MTDPAGRRVVALIDDDDDARGATAQLLGLAGFEVLAFADPRIALAKLDAGFPGILVTDVRMPHMSGIELFAAVRDRDAELPVILITGHGDVAMAVDALKAGAWDFLPKPFDPDALIAAAARAATARALVIENRRLRRETDRDAASALIGGAPAIRRLRAMLPVLADAALDLVIEGESGTGKTLLARTIHRMGRRARHRFVAIDCATVPPAMVARDLFDRAGPIARAHRGTLLLSRLDRAADALQDQLARLVEERAVALDTRDPDAVDIRIVATLAEEQRSAIRPALYHRLAGAPLRMPPLAERREDIPLLFAAFVRRIAGETGRTPPPLGDLPHRLAARDWPGNVRELAHAAERFCLGLDLYDTPDEHSGGSLTDRLDAFERTLIVEAVTAAGGDIGRAIAALALPRKTFYNRCKRLAIDLASLRGKVRGADR